MSMTRRDENRPELPKARDGGTQLADFLGLCALTAFLAAISLLAFFATTAFAG